MATPRSRAKSARRSAGYFRKQSTQLIESVLCKMESNPHTLYEDVLTAEEYREALQLMRAAVAHVQETMARQRYAGKRPRAPSRFRWCGKSYPLRYGLFLGQIFICNRSGKPLIGSGYHVI